VGPRAGGLTKKNTIIGMYSGDVLKYVRLNFYAKSKSFKGISNRAWA